MEKIYNDIRFDSCTARRIEPKNKLFICNWELYKGIYDDLINKGVDINLVYVISTTLSSYWKKDEDISAMVEFLSELDNKVLIFGEYHATFATMDKEFQKRYEGRFGDEDDVYDFESDPELEKYARLSLENDLEFIKNVYNMNDHVHWFPGDKMRYIHTSILENDLGFLSNYYNHYVVDNKIGKLVDYKPKEE